MHVAAEAVFDESLLYRCLPRGESHYGPHTAPGCMLARPHPTSSPNSKRVDATGFQSGHCCNADCGAVHGVHNRQLGSVGKGGNAHQRRVEYSTQRTLPLVPRLLPEASRWASRRAGARRTLELCLPYQACVGSPRFPRCPVTQPSPQAKNEQRRPISPNGQTGR